MILRKHFPREIQIGPDIWRIRFKKNLGKDTLGLCDPETNTIYIKTKLQRAERWDTLVHELLHSLEFSHEIELGHKTIYKLESPLGELIISLMQVCGTR